MMFKSTILAGALALVASTVHAQPTAPAAEPGWGSQVGIYNFGPTVTTTPAVPASQPGIKATDVAPLFTLVCHGEDAGATGDSAKGIDLSMTLYKQKPLVVLLQMGNGKGDRTDDVQYFPAKDGGVLKVRYVLQQFEMNAVAQLPEGKFAEFVVNHATNHGSRFDGHCAWVDPATGRIMNN
jgi:hypothetical protein